MLFVYAWVLIEPHHHQAFAYLQINLLYTYDAKNSLYNIVWNFQLPAITQRTILFLIVNYLKDLLSSNPTRFRLWAFDCSRSYKPLDLRKRMSCTAQSHLNHHGFLNDLRLTSACTPLAKNVPLQKYFAQNIMRCDQYQDYCKLYTDGSMSGYQVGSATICGTTTKTARLPNGCLLYTSPSPRD